MAEAKKPKAGKKRTMDKWKKKLWYSIVAPKAFDEKVLGETVATKPEQLDGRTISVSIYDLTSQPKKQHITLKFKVSEIRGNKAHTEVIGHQIIDAYLRRIVRRRSSKVQTIQDVITSSGKKVRVKAIAVTQGRARAKQKTLIRKIMIDQIAATKGKDINLLISEFVFGKVNSKIFNSAKKIFPIKRVEIVRSKIVG